jgi:hypothetical protein
MATATAMYHTGKNPLKRIRREGGDVPIARSGTQRKLHKAFLRYHDPQNWPLLRDALKAMGRADLIGNGQQHLIPTYQPKGDKGYQSARRKNSTPLDRSRGRGAAGRVKKGQILSQHTGLPPRETQ